MKTFRDKDKREWTFEINLAAIARVKDLVDVDLTKVLDRKSDTDEKLQDPTTLYGVICAALKPQLEARGITHEQFGEALGEEEVEEAVLALYEGVIDFFREPKRTTIRRAFHKMLEATRAEVRRKDQRLAEKVESLDFEKAAQVVLGGKDSATSSPESSESTLAT